MAADADVKVLAERVGNVQAELTSFKSDQNKKWEDNRETHQDLYKRTDRLPHWAVLFISALNLALGAALAALWR